MQRFGANGFIGKEQCMEAKSGIKPSFVDIYIEGHKGSDLENPEVLWDEQATEKLAKYKENVIQCHGPEFDWRVAALDVEAIYHTSGGLRHGRWGLGDGALEYDRIPRPQRTSQGSSSRQPSRAQQEAQQEETRRLQEETRRLREDNNYMMTSFAEMFQSFDLHNLLHRCHQTTSAVLSPKDHHLEMLRVPSNYFSTPTGQGSPLGDAQSSQPPPNEIIPSGQGSTFRGPSQNPDDVDAFLNQSGTGTAGGQAVE
ncbi:hypothetical protein U9M48_035478 [Paspalum notatum var. saurae]|uniref:Uncharacterized protein n=1 Tax=Paspalum notatum var. saurae TaxID=547442 RepID=A0AAQ3UCP8_PASNO